MDLALLQMPMVLFTTLVPMASGAFVGLALAFLTSRFSKECLARIDRWTLLPMAILAVGYIASFVALSSPQYSMSLFQGVDIAPLSFVGIAGMLFIALAVVYWIIAMTGNLDERPRKVFATVVGAASLLLSLSIGVMYMGSAVLTWNSPLVPLGIIGFCIAGGVPLGVLVVALAGGMPEARLTRLPTVALFTAFIGVVAAPLPRRPREQRAAAVRPVHVQRVLSGLRRASRFVGVPRDIHRGVRCYAGDSARHAHARRPQCGGDGKDGGCCGGHPAARSRGRRC